MAKRFNIDYYIKEGFRSIFTHGFMSFAAVCMIVACLLIMGSFTLVAVNLDRMLGQLEAENEFLAYIDEDYSEMDARALEGLILQTPNVASATFVTRAQALDNYRQGREENALLGELPPEVLRDRFNIHVTDIEQMAQTVAQVEQIPGVVKTSAMLAIAQGFVMVRNIASGIALIMITTLVLISLFIISNTIRLATFYRREEIAIMKMCGATNAFVRWPFIVEGMLLGFAGAIVAFFFQWGIYELVSEMVMQEGGMGLVALIPYQSMAGTIFWVFAGTGFVIGVVGSMLAIRKFLQV